MKKAFMVFLFLCITMQVFPQYISKDSTGKAYINFNSLDESITCDSVQGLIRKYGSVEKIPDPDLRLIAVMAQLKCSVSMLNKLSETLQDTSIHQYQAQVLMEEDSIGNPRVLFNLMDLSTLNNARDYAKRLVDFAPVILMGRTNMVGDILLRTGVATSLAKYTIDAYYEGAVKSDPLIILYPAVIPARKISHNVVQQLRKNKVFNEFTQNWEHSLDGVINPLGKIGAAGLKEVVKGTEKITRETAKATDNVIKAVKKRTHLNVD